MAKKPRSITLHGEEVYYTLTITIDPPGGGTVAATVIK
jgi:hypothetical protein